MHTFDSHSIEILEYPKIIAILRGLCLTPYGMTIAAQTAPFTDIASIQIRLDEISQMKDIIRFGESIPLYRLEDSMEIIHRSKTEGLCLDPLELLKILELIEVSAALHNYAKSDRNKFPLIAKYLANLHPFPDIRKAIIRAIDRDGSILDSASQKLKRIRIDISGLKRKIINRLDKMLSQRQKHPGWQDDTITQRDGRYVIPILSGQFRHDSGIIHDRSQSGATLFVEPKETVELNNQLEIMSQEERLEIDRILREITAQIAIASDQMKNNCNIIGLLDYIHAAAGLAIKTDSHQPVIRGKSWFNLISAQHPLLLYYTKDKEGVVPSDFHLDSNRLAIIITGPNTGGKTVALKTVGLLILMAQSGLHIPADSKTEIGIFKNIFVDIGDEQSIELSLSTFSSHIRQIIFAVRNAGPNCLVLLDEIGAGTDPKEGAALAEAILLKMLQLKTKTIVTTHYSQLKTLPTLFPEIENASFEFDRKSLRPTFRLQTGIPGASYAVEIAHRLGMPADITDKASDLIGKDERSLAGLSESLETELAALRKDKATLEDKLKNASQLEDYYKSQAEKLEREIDTSKKRLLEEMETTLSETRIEIEKLVKEIRESKASDKSVKRIHKILKEKTNKVNHYKAKYIPKVVATEEIKPGDRVWIESLKQEGELVELIGQNRARIRVGNIMTTLEKSNLKKLADQKRRTDTQTGSTNLSSLSVPGPEINLRGMTVDEATEAIDKFIDSAILAGMTQIYVIHGIGTGALRRTISEFLKNHSSVESFRLGNWNEGGAGITIVKLK